MFQVNLIRVGHLRCLLEPRGLDPVARPARASMLRTISLVAVLAALAIIGRIAFLWAPNYALTYFVVFLAGVLLGPLAGAGVGVIAMTSTNLLLSGLHPVLVANATGMAFLGLMGGAMRPLFLSPVRTRLDRALRFTVAGAVGLFGTFAFSVLGDLMGFLLQFVLTPEGATIGTSALGPMVLMGLVFNLGPALVNMVLFATATPALVASLQKSGHVWAPRGPPPTDGQTGRATDTAARTPGHGAATARHGHP